MPMLEAHVVKGKRTECNNHSKLVLEERRRLQRRVAMLLHGLHSHSISILWY